MKVFICVVNDRHADPEATAWTTADAAIEHARTEARACARHPEDYEERTVEGWLFYVRYSCEGDSAWVVEREVRG
ncbi:MAG TPA: hypothetical protein VJ140_14050 [Actinomycetota bacterium]|nr:hypothetical protein [Actinomycetota bacterium]